MAAHPALGISASPQSEIDGVLRANQGARTEEHALPNGRPYWRYVGQAGDLPRHLRHDHGHASD